MSGPARKAALGALLAVAVGVAIGALAFGGSGGGGEGSAAVVDPTPISLPPRLDGYTDVVQVAAANGASGDQVTEQRAHQGEVEAATEAAYRRAFDGAATAYRAYADPGLERMPYVIAVRAQAPGMTLGPVVSGAFLGLATPEREVKTVGPVSCEILWSPPTVAGKTPDPANEQVVTCQRSAKDATVFVGAAGFKGPGGLRSMARFTEAAWRTVAGG